MKFKLLAGFVKLGTLFAVFMCDSASSQVPPCSGGWFGSRCQYKCHCPSRSRCNSSGECPYSFDCDKGWFGPACQYVDLISTNSVPMKFICSRTGSGQKSLIISFPDTYFTWLRLRVSQKGISQSYNLQFNDNSECSNMKMVPVSETELDIQCDPGVAFQKLNLTGDGVSFLCSLYVSGGRNVALRQRTSQSSNFSNQATSDKAVDGKRDARFDYKSCTHTNKNNPPTWTLTFQQPYRVNRYVLYNRDSLQERLLGFSLKAFQDNGNLPITYTETSNTAQHVYTVTSTSPEIAVSVIQIAGREYLTLCEVEMFGDSACDGAKYGRECEKECRCTSQDEKCFVSTGGCSSGCRAGYHGFDCQQPCWPKYFGENCNEKCSTNCESQLCVATNGICNSCIPGKQGSRCDRDCDQTYFGKNCEQSCSSNCKDRICAPTNGACTACVPGKTGAACNQACWAKYFGENCNEKCSNNCESQLCVATNGICNSCIPGKQGSRCDRDCDQTYFGKNCEQSCSSNCKDRICAPTNGACTACVPGKTGAACNQENCNEKCSNNCESQLCVATNGICNSCIPGKQGSRCDRDCDQTYYGKNCALRCSSNCKDRMCAPTNGDCTACVPGKTGAACYHDCPKTSFGDKCVKRCSSNCKDMRCEPSNGTCKSCIAGKTGGLCDQDCPATYFGESCTQRCDLNCKNRLCSATSGMCTSCVAGKSGEQCNKNCIDTYFGENCAEICSLHCSNQLCNITDGMCQACVPGWSGLWCEEQKQTSDGQGDGSPSVDVIVGPIIALVVLALLIVIGVIFWRKRGHKKEDHCHIVESNHADAADITAINDTAVLRSPEIAMTARGIKSFKVKKKTKLPNNPNGIQGAAADSIYANCVPGVGDTTIRAANLNTFMTSHSKIFFREQFANIPESISSTTIEALSQTNQNKNRYKNIIPYDHNRVHLQTDSAKKQGNYINASYINGFKQQKKFIASQGPTKTILEDFIRMLWEQSVEVVVMLTNLIEDGKSPNAHMVANEGLKMVIFGRSEEMLKCEQYWPDDGEIHIGEIIVKLTTTQVFSDYTIRRLHLIKTREPEKVITHFHFTAWPDKGVPTSAWGLVELEQRMASVITDKPIVVHCSAGVGRTGTFIALHNILEEIKETGQMDIFTAVKNLRKDRINMVQNWEQYIFVHMAVQVALVCKGTTVTSSDIRDRIQHLNEMSTSGQSNMQEEFNSICLVCTDDYKGTSGDETEENSMYYNSCTVTNQLKSRDPTILPKENYRPILACENVNLGSYINATFVPSPKRQDQQFLTQLPLPTTIIDFWRLINQYNVALIVALEKYMQAEDQTIGDYLHEGKDNSTTFSLFNIKTNLTKKNQDWEVHRIAINMNAKKTKTTKADSVERDVSHLTCKSTNLDPETLLELVRQIRSMKPIGEGRTLYMCRNGSALSGLVCILVLILDKLDIDQQVSVPLVVGTVKAIRPQVIPSMNQYKLLYETLHLYFETNNVYSNFGSTG